MARRGLMDRLAAGASDRRAPGAPLLGARGRGKAWRETVSAAIHPAQFVKAEQARVYAGEMSDPHSR